MSVTTETREVKVGDKVRVLYVPSVSDTRRKELIGKIVEVSEVANTRHYARDPETGTEILQEGTFCYGRFETNTGLENYYFTEWEFVDESAEPENPEIVSLRDQLAASQQQLESVRNQRDKFLIEFDKLGEIIMACASEAGYCSEYDELVDEINACCASRDISLRLPSREQEFEINVRWEAKVFGYTTITVTASNMERALQEIRENDYDYLDDIQLVRDEIDSNGLDEFDWQIRD